MKISELVSELEVLWAQHGDVDVFGGGRDTAQPPTPAFVEGCLPTGVFL